MTVGSRTLDSSQDPLWVRSHLTPLNLVKLTTYTDRIAETVDETFYFANHATCIGRCFRRSTPRVSNYSTTPSS